MRLLICAGGTGGGVYPALSVLQALKSEAQPVLWVGSEGGMEAGLVTRLGVPFQPIPAAGVHGVGLRSLPRNLVRLARGTWSARRILSQFRPDVLLFTGGYVAAPMAWVGRSIPSLVFCPDVEPGMALKFLARFANRIAVTVTDSRQYFPAAKRVQVTGYPLRPELTAWQKDAARTHLGLRPQQPVLLVTGGSKGAHTINQAITAILPQVLTFCQVLHLTGTPDWAAAQAVRAALPPQHAADYHPYEFLHEDMGAAMAAADLVVSRAGASSLGEYPFFGLPAILVPYPYAWRYQKVNAGYLAEKGGAVLLEDGAMGSSLLPALQELLSQSSRLAAMRAAMVSLARPHAAEELAQLVRELAVSRKETA